MNEICKTWCRRAWRVGRPLLIGYLIVLLVMTLLETWLVYPAPPATYGNWNPAGLGHEDVWFESVDGTRLHGWFVPHPNPKRALLYCHGNGEHIAFNADLAAQLRDRLEASVFLFDYRGYGRSSGRPTEAGCIADGRAAQKWLAERMQIEPADMVLMGRSLGGAVAIALAAEEGARALVVESTFGTMTDVAALHFPWLPVRWAMSNRYDSVSRLKRYAGPVLLSHGSDDTLVPVVMAETLFQSASHPLKRWLEHPELGHNSTWPDSYYDELAAFLEEVEVARGIDPQSDPTSSAG